MTGTTEFVEDIATREFHKEDPTTINHKLGIAKYHDQGIAEFLAKPVEIDNFEWATTSAANDVIGTYDIAALMEAQTIWTRKMEGYNLVRGTACIRVQVNAQPFQQGRLLVHFLPFVDHMTARYAAGHNFNLTTKSQQPHVEIDCRDTSGVLHIPYIAPTQWYDRTDGVFEWGTVYISVLAPLQIGAGGPTSADVTVWLSFDNFEVSAPIYPQSSLESGPRRQNRSIGRAVAETEAAGAAAGGTVSKILTTTSKVASVLTEVPALAPIAGPVAWLTGLGAKVAAVFGWSKPLNEATTQKTLIRAAADLANTDGTFSGANMGLSVTNKLQISDSFAGTGEDEMSFEFLKRIPAFIESFTFATSDLQGDLLYEKQLSMNTLCSNTTIVAGTASYFTMTGPPFVHVAQYFRYYRGSVNLHLKFVKTDYHSGRVIVAFTPLHNVTAPTNAESSFLQREIIDIRKSSEYTFNIPYLQNRSYIPLETDIGKLSIRVSNELRCPETTAQEITCQVWFSAGDDFELQVPRQPSHVPIYPQSNIKLNKDTEGSKSGIGSSDPVPRSLSHVAQCIGESFQSIKQLINRPCPLRVNLTAEPNQDWNGFLWPFVITPCVVQTNSTTATQPYVGGDYISDFAQAYALSRGSVRITQLSKSALESVLAYIQQRSDLNTIIVDAQATYASNDWTIAPSTARCFPVSFHKLQNDTMEVQIPHYGATPSRLNVPTNQNTRPTDISQPYTYLFYRRSASSGATGDSYMLRSGGDDYQLGYFIGFVPTFYAAS